MIRFKAKDSEIVAIPLCLGKRFKKLVSRWYEGYLLNGYAYDFSVDYNAIAVDDILSI